MVARASQNPAHLRSLLAAPRRVHIVGVGGPGTSAIAIILAEMGHRVSGSDMRESETLARLRQRGIAVNVPHRADVVNGCDVVTASAAVPATNLELQAATANGITVLTRAEMLGAITPHARTVAVAGTHGKTTTTSLLTMMLRAGGVNPGWLIGADVPQLPASAHWGGELFVLEADESDSSHLAIRARASILTNIDVDHLDEHGSLAGITASFDAMLAATDGPRVVCADDPAAASLVAAHDAITYGISPTATVRATDVRFAAGAADFVARWGSSEHDSVPVRLPLRGLHNVRNFLAALAMAQALGVSPVVAAAAVDTFSGVHRRFQVRAHHDGATFVDDYAHLPAEIVATLAAARDESDTWRRVIAVFQPNRFHRMALMSDEYRDSFVSADLVVITDIYASGTERIDGVTGELVVDAVRRAHPQMRVEWVPQRSELIDFVAREVGPGDLCVSMGCGDIETLPDEVVARREELSHGR
ncbi:MAG: UDP-N-acetylmuramate--L-alanine ligase [Actinobacteria bacterium]|nr:UDP-N-acetylmuramate--L-alanine ligase [Actinomycetota bacterium]